MGACSANRRTARRLVDLSAWLSLQPYEVAASLDNRGATCSRSDAVELGLEVALAAQADDLIGHFAALENQESWDGADAVLSSQALEVVDVELGDLDLAIVFGGELVQDGGDHFAGTAPFGPEVDQHWHG